MPANSPYPGESQEQFAMRQQENVGGGEAEIRKAIAQRYPDVLPDKLDEVYQSWLAFAEGQGGQPDLEQFFQQYEADAQGFGGREVNQELPPELLARMKEAQPQQEMMQEMPTSLMQQSDAGQYPEPSPQELEAMRGAAGNILQSTIYGTLGGRGSRGIRKPN